MKFEELATERLFLRAFREEDFAAVHSWAGDGEALQYMRFGPNSEEETRAFLRQAIAETRAEDCRNFHFIAVLRTTGEPIGEAALMRHGEDLADLGWILHRSYWKRGYGAEIGKALLEVGFGRLGLHRIIAHCDGENYGSYRVMENIGMRREGLFLQGRKGNRVLDYAWRDELAYAILQEEWQARR